MIDLADDWGIGEGYYDALGHWRGHKDSAVEAILGSMKAIAAGPPPAAMLVIGPTTVLNVANPSVLTTEDGAEIRLEGDLPSHLPLGYHTLTDLERGTVTAVAVTPGSCPLPSRPSWGWAVQTYALRSARSWGVGDFGDLAQLAQWSATKLGASILLTSPLHAPLPTRPQTASPYYPSSRRFRSPLYLRIEDVPGAADMGMDLAALANAGKALNTQRLIDHDQVFELKMEALDRLWDAFCGDGVGDRDHRDNRRFNAWTNDQGASLANYATFCVLVEHHGRRWREWPPRYRHPHGPDVATFGREQARRVRFHAWLQWQLDCQLAAVADTIALMTDLAVGVDPDGADAWLWQDAFAPGISVGAPPDEFNPDGQDWGVAAFDPWRLRQAAYQPFIETVRSALVHARGVRIDHVMALFRLFWIPNGQSPESGAYVRYPAADLVGLLALEAHRAGAYVVGEDLGTVSDEIRSALAVAGICSTRLGWFEDDPPEQWPAASLGALTTHDLPTAAGLWTGSDEADQRSIGMTVEGASVARVRARLARLAGATGGPGTVSDVVVNAHQSLARAGSLTVTATLDDALAVAERPNMPGTIDQWPNWRLGLPKTLEDIMTDPLPQAIASAMDNRSTTARP